jgi:sarcosine dehydrogenase
VFDALDAGGQSRWDIRPVGYRALESLRLEKGYRAWGSDITPNDTPFMRPGWAGRCGEARTPVSSASRRLQALAGQPLTKRFAGFVIDDPDAVLVGRETILRNGQPVGYLTSGGYGYTIGKSHRLRLCSQRRRGIQRIS